MTKCEQGTEDWASDAGTLEGFKACQKGLQGPYVHPE
jgi:hypothetical protein